MKSTLRSQSLRSSCSNTKLLKLTHSTKALAATANINQSADFSRQDYRLKLKRRNKSLGYSDGIISHIAGSSQFADIRHDISKCTSSAEIISILQNGTSVRLIDESVYGKALQKCLALTDWPRALEIFKSIPIQNRSLIIYNIVINGLCKNDRITNALQLFDEMIASPSITPDLKTYSSLITGCKYRAKWNWKIAEKLWFTMIGSGLRPNLIAYNAMITVYVQTQQIDKVEALWTQLLDLPELREFKSSNSDFSEIPNSEKPNSESSNSEEANVRKHAMAMSAVCGNMMNCYALQQSTDKVMAMKQWMFSHDVPLTNIHFSIILKCFERAGAPEKVVEVFNSEIIRNPNVKMEHILICQVAVALLQIMRKHPEDKVLHKKYCKMITETIPKQYSSLWKDSHPSNYWLGKIQFDALLYRYSRKGKEHRLGKKFRRLGEMGKLHGIWNDNVFELKGNRCIDLHAHSEDAAVWILKYVLQYDDGKKERKFLKQMVEEGKEMVVLCGKGAHNHHHEPKLNRRVVQELASWTPPVSATPHPLNKACVLLNSEDIRGWMHKL